MKLADSDQSAIAAEREDPEKLRFFVPELFLHKPL